MPGTTGLTVVLVFELTVTVNSSEALPLTVAVNVADSPTTKVSSLITIVTFFLAAVNVLLILEALWVELPANVATTRYDPSAINTFSGLKPLTVTVKLSALSNPSIVAVNDLVSPAVKVTSGISNTTSNLSRTLITVDATSAALYTSSPR